MSGVDQALNYPFTLEIRYSEVSTIVNTNQFNNVCLTIFSYSLSISSTNVGHRQPLPTLHFVKVEIFASSSFTSVTFPGKFESFSFMLLLSSIKFEVFQ